MRSLILAAVAVGALLVAAGSAEAQCFGGARGFGVYGGGFNRGFVGGGVPVQRGRNGFFSAGGRGLVFVGFDRFGNPIFR